MSDELLTQEEINNLLSDIPWDEDPDNIVIIYRIKHKPTGLFYCSVKGRWQENKTNLSKKGNIYTELKMCEKVLEENCNCVYINKAQVDRYKLEINNKDDFTYSKALKEDFVIVKYSLLEIN